MSPRSVADYTREIRALREQIRLRGENVPNLRDYGLDRRAEFEQAIADYHAETTRLVDRFQALGYERLAVSQTRHSVPESIDNWIAGA
jgi:hypothetical protein